MSDDKESLMSRWSRLKRRGPDNDLPVEDPAISDPPGVAQDIASPASAHDQAALLQSLGLPEPETLVLGDDFSRFMAPDVPAFLRRRALRVLWRSNPGLAGLDGLVDYGEDFSANGVGDMIQTAYQVGRGFLKELSEPSDAKHGAPEAESTIDVRTDQGDLVETPPQSMSSVREPTMTAPQHPETDRDQVEIEIEARNMPRPRRMVFVEDEEN